MMHPFKLLLAVATVAGASTLSVPSQAQSAKPEAATAKSGSAASNKGSAAVDEFEENRRAHMQKSKENNAKKGAE